MSALSALETSALLDASESNAARRLVVTWQNPVTRSIQPVGVLALDGGRYRFRYIRNALDVEGFRPLLGFSDLHEVYEDDELFPLFLQRAMDPRRPDFTRYVTQLGLPADTTPWEQIARSGGRRQGDMLQLFPVPRREGTGLVFTFLVHGMRHIGEDGRLRDAEGVPVSRDDVERAMAMLVPGDPLALVDDPVNPHNAEAILTCSVGGTPIGYVPDLLLTDVHALRQRSRLVLTAEVVNGPEVPWHLRLLARAVVPDAGDFTFFTGSRWDALV